MGQLRAKTYACYTVYTRPNQTHVQTLAPPGSTFDFAWDMFCKFFKKRVGVEWKDRQNAASLIRLNRVQEWKFSGEDGAGDDGFFKVLGSLGRKEADEPGVEAIESIEERKRKPSVTVLVNADQLITKEAAGAMATTPEGVW